jgi:hypothetical protein
MINVNSKYVGITYLDMQYNLNIVESFSEKYNAYLVRTEEGAAFLNIVPESELEFFLNKQELIIKSKNKAELAAQQEQEKKNQAEAAYNNVNGYCDNMNAMQKGKVLKVLNKEFFFRGKAITRKEFVSTLINEGYNLRIIDTVMTSSKKVKGERIDKYKNNVPVIEKDGSYYEITNTEYEYGLYLIAQ